MVASFIIFFVIAILFRLSNSIWILNVPKRAFIVRQTAMAEVCHLFTASGAKGTGWVVNGNQQTGNIQGNGNEKLNKQPVNRARK